MTILIYLGIAAALFIIGILFILKGLPNEEEQAVPIKNPQEIQKLKQSFTPSEPKEVSSGIAAEKAAHPDPSGAEPELENHQLRKDILDERTKATELERQLEAMKREYEQAKEEHQRALRVMQEENTRHRTEMEQKTENDNRLNELRAKTELLEHQYTQSQQQQEDLRTTVEQLKVERERLITRSQEQPTPSGGTPTKVANKAEFDLLSNKLIESIATLEDLKRSNKELAKENDRLSSEYDKIKAMNDQLMKKEKMMQYELTKNRAQAMGLERICADFRTQIETMAGSASVKK